MNTHKEEQWRPVPGYGADYEVSSHGRVRSHRRGSTKILKPIHERYNNYYVVSLFNSNGKMRKVKISRLVALAFIPNPHNYPVTNHKDENKLNNHIDNLEWCTYSYNNSYGTVIERRLKTATRNRARRQ
ncbi:MAG: NUMOD4 motif-containing HNH endonuclease [Defluviitaleaceae bacterium]|nr:NUMOD4 motif-containing HNH endonuclease [Defluviitaleaceae bacterium]